MGGDEEKVTEKERENGCEGGRWKHRDWSSLGFNDAVCGQSLDLSIQVQP